MADWRGLLSRNLPDARDVLRQLLTGPIRFRPVIEERRRGYAFEGAIALDRVTVTPIGRRAWSLRLIDPAAAVLDASDGLPWFPVRGIYVRRIDRRAVAVHRSPRPPIGT